VHLCCTGSFATGKYTWGKMGVLGQNGIGQNGTDKMARIESSNNQAIQLLICDV